MSAADLSVQQLGDIARRTVRDRVRSLVRRAQDAGAETVDRALEIVERRLKFGFARTKAHYYGEARRVDWAEMQRIEFVIQKIRQSEARTDALHKAIMGAGSSPVGSFYGVDRTDDE